LDRLISYYAKAEPSSPVPMLLERAKRLVGADFITIVKDMASGGYPNVKTIGGLSDEDDY
jgi:type VI secretion system protein ImpA